MTEGPDFEDEEDEGGSAESASWMNTFADLMSLLLTFFVLLLSFANMDVVKFATMVESMREAFGSQVSAGRLSEGSSALVDVSEQEASSSARMISRRKPARNPDLLKRVKMTVSGEGLERLVEVEQTDRGVVARVRGELLFEPGRAELRPESLVFLEEMGVLVKEMRGKVSIEGHTDDRPVGEGFESNWHLSAERAVTTLAYLVDVAGVDPTRLSATGYAHHRPLAPNDSPEGRRRNRRVEFVFLREAAAEPERARGPESAGGGEAVLPLGSG